METTAIDTFDGVDAAEQVADDTVADDTAPRVTAADEPAIVEPPQCSGFGSVVESLFADGRLVHLETIDPRPAAHADLESELPAAVSHCLPEAGLYGHQAEAIDLIRRGRSVVVATGTASGKSLCFQIPIAESIVTGLRSGTSLLLYPTKALAQDQLRAFNDMEVKGMKAAAYDGDASRDERTWARNNANVLLTNPEMLHHGLLPHHGKWATFLKRLDYIVVDELHIFRGIFGTHLAHVLRRLRRLCQRYGSDPTFVFCSATIGRPEELAAELCGKDVVAVTDDGSPYGRRHIALVQPAWIDAERGIRQSPATETIRVITDLVLADRRIIAFCGSRALTERVAAGVARNLPPELREMVRPYRSGYLAAERREIEAELTGGSLRAVVTTSALELGVDIGGLDATVLCGFPGTVASMWQQIGRAGRVQQDSLAVLVAGEDQLDQWFMAHPSELFERPPEPAVVNVANPNILDPHLGCAAYEWPLKHNDDEWWPDLDDAVHRNVLADQMRIRPDGRRLPRAVWDGPGRPFHRIGLRSASGGELRIVDDDGDLIGTVEKTRAAHLVHPGAVYLHRGQSFKVLDLDLAARTATVEPDDGSTWTQAKSTIDIEVLDTGSAKDVGRSTLHLGRVRVTTQVVGYQVKATGSRETLASEDLDLPPEELVTTSIWYEWQHELIAQAGIRGFALPGALHAAEHAAIGILPLFTICDRWDVGGVSIASAPHSGLPTIFIYDGYPGGAGIADLAFAAADRHLAATADILDACQCVTGCPSCVQSPKCGNGNEPLDKMAALALLVNTLGLPEPF
ncbi:MAG: DEAD/DEAH box helicase [Acidimicrobiia bacterium]|nr:DEAD/DEAH box helicase [Acidimicrobiia bacterium]